MQTSTVVINKTPYARLTPGLLAGLVKPVAALVSSSPSSDSPVFVAALVVMGAAASTKSCIDDLDGIVGTTVAAAVSKTSSQSMHRACVPSSETLTFLAKCARVYSVPLLRSWPGVRTMLLSSFQDAREALRAGALRVLDEILKSRSDGVDAGDGDVDTVDAPPGAPGSRRSAAPLQERQSRGRRRHHPHRRREIVVPAPRLPRRTPLPAEAPAAWYCRQRRVGRWL